VLGDLDVFAQADYRVAMAMWTAYRDLGDKSMAQAAFVHVRALRGERSVAVEPPL